MQDSVILAINEEYVDMQTPVTLKPSDVIAIIPPLSGG